MGNVLYSDTTPGWGDARIERVVSKADPEELVVEDLPSDPEKRTDVLKDNMKAGSVVEYETLNGDSKRGMIVDAESTGENEYLYTVMDYKGQEVRYGQIADSDDGPVEIGDVKIRGTVDKKATVEEDGLFAVKDPGLDGNLGESDIDSDYDIDGTEKVVAAANRTFGRTTGLIESGREEIAEEIMQQKSYGLNNVHEMTAVTVQQMRNRGPEEVARSRPELAHAINKNIAQYDELNNIEHLK